MPELSRELKEIKKKYGVVSREKDLEMTRKILDRK